MAHAPRVAVETRCFASLQQRNTNDFKRRTPNLTPQTPMERREFLLKTCMTGLALTGCSFLFTECKPTAAIHETTDEIFVPVSSFKGKNNLVVTSTKHKQNILVVKQQDGNYHALSMTCTHKGATVDLKGEQLVCPSHGSRFDLEGNVVKAPAARPLKKYNVSEKKGEIVISLI